MKKMSKALAATLLLSATAAPMSVFAADFPDLDAASFWAKDEIVKAQQLGLIKGDEFGNFRPLNTITRQEIAAIFARILNLDTSTSSTTSFLDVNGQWGKNYIESLHNAGLMNGDGNGYFRPNDKITREELAILLVRAAKANTAGKAAGLTVADKGEIDDWAKDAVQAAIDLGLMKGDGVYFHPRDQLKRQEMAVTAVRVFNFLAPQSITNITADTATINGVTYQLSDNVKGVLNPANIPVLDKAKIQFERDNNTITKITSLELTSSGNNAVDGTAEFSGNLVLNGNNATIDGNVKVSGDYISLKNLKITGNLEIAEPVQHDFYSNNITVGGNTYINGGSAETVAFENSSLNEAYVKKAGVRVQTLGTTMVNLVNVFSNATVSAGAGTTVKKLSLTDKCSVVLEGTFEKVEIAHLEARLSLASGARIKELVLYEDMKASDFITNYEAVKGQIDKITQLSVPTPPPAGGGTGGTGTGGTGGTGGGTTPTPPTVPAAPSVNNISVVDEVYSVSANDTVTVDGLSVGDAVYLYDSSSPSSSAIKTATVTSGSTANLVLDLGTVSEAVYLSVYRNGMESGRTEVNLAAATVSSSVYTIDNPKGTITGAAGTDYNSFIAGLTPAQGATIKVYSGTSQVTSGTIAVGYIVEVTNGRVTKKYRIE